MVSPQSRLISIREHRNFPVKLPKLDIVADGQFASLRGCLFVICAN
jgi:hypothetical protein